MKVHNNITIQQYELLLPLVIVNIKLHRVVYHNNSIPYLKRADLIFRLLIMTVFVLYIVLIKSHYKTLPHLYKTRYNKLLCVLVVMSDG